MYTVHFVQIFMTTSIALSSIFLFQFKVSIAFFNANYFYTIFFKFGMQAEFYYAPAALSKLELFIVSS